MQIRKIFLASSEELKEDRRRFEIFIGRKNEEWVTRGVFLKLVVWETFLDAMSQTRLQDEYNRAVRDCDVFVMLFATKVGKYTQEEFETAHAHFAANRRPYIYTYFRDVPVSIWNLREDDLLSLLKFKRKLEELGHFATLYRSGEDLELAFDRQLDKLADLGLISAATAPAVALPQLTFGSWTLRNSIDDGGTDWSNSVLKFTSQEPDGAGNLRLTGSFTWRRVSELVGTEAIEGHYVSSNRQLILEGRSVTNPGTLAVGSYSATLSADERQLVDGTWGSSVQDTAAPGMPGRWEARR